MFLGFPASVNIYVYIKEDHSIRTSQEHTNARRPRRSNVANSLKCMLNIPYHSFDITFSGSFQYHVSSVILPSVSLYVNRQPGIE